MYELSSVSLVLVFFVFMGYFVYLEHYSLLKTRFDFLFRFFLPFFILFPESGFVTFEVLYHKRIKKPLKFHLKRLTANSLVLVLGVVLLFGFVLGLHPFLSPIVGNNDFLISVLLTLLVFSVIILRFKNVIVKLNKG